MIQIRNAIDVLNRLGFTSRQELEEELPRLQALEAWLRAEYVHKGHVEAWLKAEQKWHHQEWMAQNSQVYQSAKAGWEKMRESSPRLDGVASFDLLGVGLQQRYARFAAGVLESIGVFDDQA
ncbi:hypothetical protein [Mycobacterium sp. CnD-18-1]|uniref:hypothetical protein n=1 Tax=Mycobacterium sp. CnD-18-1 TaxID=2917744 RepID=UPI001EF1B295|nr:hypothetical protein [Mycobacterium sp. CnD-18-1]MCG7607175.1 hypothetical protein [Mycobacterium sp. CnD-18-1]